MKYTSIEESGEKTHRAGLLDGGINREAAAAHIKSSELSDGRNVCFYKGALRRRPSLTATTEDIIKNGDDSLIESSEFFSAETELFIDGEYNRIAYEKAFDGISNYIYNVFLIGANGQSRAAGSIYFSRISSDTFFTPESILFFTGASTGGGGIFAFVTAVNIYDTSQKSYRVYEINAEKTAWERKTSFYTPVVMINGRGNRYEYAKSVNSPFSGAPKSLEARNLLTSRFKAYFTSDGHSSLFRLPYSELANESVICRIYTNPTSYTEWCIYPDESSATEAFFTAQITMQVDRDKGTVFFTGADGSDYPVPLMSRYSENNIRITAGKAFADEFDEACSLTCCCRCGSHTVFSGGLKAGRIYSVNSEKPLYFSEKCVKSTGEGTGGITALLNTADGIIAFKKNEILRLTLKTGGAIGNGSLLADDASVFYEPDSFTLRSFNAPGCENKRACTVCGRSLIWLAADGKIHTMSTASGKAEELTRASALSAELKQAASTAVAVGNPEHAVFMFGKKMLVIKNPEANATAKCFLWSFEATSVRDAIFCGEECRFFCVGSDGKIFYTAIADSTAADTDISSSGGNAVIKPVPITAEFKTKDFAFGAHELKKHIRRITLSAAFGGPSELKLIADGKCAYSVRLPASDTRGTLDVIRIIPHIAEVGSLTLHFHSENEFEIGDIAFNYITAAL